MCLRFCILLLPLWFAGCSSVQKPPLARSGTIDLRSLDLGKKEVPLDGEWKLVWKTDTLLSHQPGSWIDVTLGDKPLPQEGRATYLLQVFLPPGHGQNLVISTKEINTQSRIRLNGQWIPEYGNERLYHHFEYVGDSLRIEIEVQNRFDIRPGIPCPVYLGERGIMESRAQLFLGIQFFLIGIFVLFTVLYGVMWCTGKRRDRAQLLLAVNTLAWLVYSFFQGVEASPAELLLPSIPLIWLQKIYLVATAISYTMTCLLWFQLFPSRLLRFSIPILGAISLVFSAVILQDTAIHWQWVEWYLILGSLFLFQLLWVVGKASVSKVPGSLVFLFGLLGLLGVFVWGTISFRGEWMGYGALMLVLADAILLASRQERLRRLKEELATAVQQKFQHALQEERLSSLLDHIESPILVLNDSEQVSYVNQEFCKLLCSAKSDLMGLAWGEICVQELARTDGCFLCELHRSRGQSSWVAVRKTEISMGSESLTRVFVQKGQVSEFDLISGVQPASLLATPHELACEVMRLSVDVWVGCTGLEKADLAESSGIWKVHADPNGWRRTLTLDKYLDSEKIPQLPKWRKVLDTAEFALLTAQHRNWVDARISLLKERKQQLSELVG